MIDSPHAVDSEPVLRELNIDSRRGVPEAEVESRRARYGANVLPRGKQRRLLTAVREQLLNVIVLLLASAAVVSWITAEKLEAVAILIVLLINMVVGLATEWQSGRALEALRKQMRLSATVRRDGHLRQVSSDELVVGDIVEVTGGDRIPADLRLLQTSRILAEESALTGESRTVAKSVAPVAADALLAERSSMLYLGTLLAAGHGIGIVTATGANTELGRIGRLVADIETEPTLLQQRLNQLGRRLVWVVLAISAVVIATGLLRGEPLWQMIEVGISLAVAAVPEALPAVTTFILAFGVLRMARRNAIVRRLSAVETLGSTTVICSDKTGTLTLNQMTVMEVRLPEGSSPRLDDSEAALALGRAALCSDATADTGDPTEVAIVRAAGPSVATLRASYPRVSEQPFDAQTRRMMTTHRMGDQFLSIIKGAPQVILSATDLDGAEKERILELNRRLASQGLRVLAVAEKNSDSYADPGADGFTLLGLIGLTDPPRSEAKESIAIARRAGIRVVMLTGDQIETGRAIARQLGIGDGEPRVRHGRGLDAESDQQLATIAGQTDVFARVSPEDKFRIVKALQATGEVVAVTGDGVNDAPALKTADVGVAMGQRGTEVAKEASDIVLADDNFATIVAAIEGGRTIYGNIVRFVHLMFSHNLNEVLTIFGALLIGWPLPLFPLQILWLNLVTDVFPAFALALEPAAPDTMERPPRSPQKPLFSGSFLGLIAWQGSLLAAISLLSYGWALRIYGPGDHARTVALLALVGSQIGHTFNCRSRFHSAFRGLTRNPHVFFATATVTGLQVLAFTVPPIRNVLRLVPPNGRDLVAFTIAVVLPIVVVELQKLILRRMTGLRSEA